MKGWGTNKVAVIGRNSDDRVIPYGAMLSKELGFTVSTFAFDKNAGYTREQILALNQQWVNFLKSHGYTIYDIGLNPRYTSGAATGSPNFDEDIFYKMELDNIFR